MTARVFVLLAIGAASPAPAGIPPAAVEEMKKEFQQSRTHISESESRKREVLSRIFHINRNIKKIAEEKGTLNYHMVTAKANAKDTAKKIVELEKSIEDQRNGLRRRLRMLFKIQGQGYLRALFSSASPQALERNIRFLSLITKKDYELIKVYRETRDRLIATRHELQDRVRELVAVQTKIGKSEKNLIAEQNEKAALVAEIEKEKEWYLGRIRAIREKTRDLELNAESLLSRSLFFERRGQLAWPVNQPVAQGFGVLELGEHGTKMNHKGLQFAAPAEELPVQAVFAGRIGFVGEIEGYGRVVIVDHKDHYYTVYGHLDGVAVSLNQKVESLQRIGRVKSRGLYFEIRHFSQPEDPAEWLSENEIKISSKEQTINEG